MSPQVVSLAGHCPLATEVSAITTFSVDVPSPAPRSRLYGRRTSMHPIDLCLPSFANKDFIPASLQSMCVATQEYPASPASPTSLASQSMCLDLYAISSGDSEVGGSSALHSSPVLIID